MGLETRKTFDAVLERFRKGSFSEQDKGYRFERLMQAYLRTDPKYAYSLDKIWLWKDFPARKDFGKGNDVGIDLVARTMEGEFWAIQCKCYREESSIAKASVDSFLSTSSRHFSFEGVGEQLSFSQRLWISTTNNWTSTAEEAIRNQEPPVTRLNLSELQKAPVDWGKIEQGFFGEESRTAKKILHAHQVEALEKTHEYLKVHDRGKLIMACGTGKTLTSLRIAERETGERGLVLFYVLTFCFYN